MFSKACEYGMRATIYVAQQSVLDKKVGVKEIAEAIESPQAFTGKIMQQLTKQQIVQSAKGPNGGFFIDKDQLEQVRLSEIVSLFDGEKAYSGCVLGLRACSETHPCPIHKSSAPIISDLKHLLETKSLRDIVYSGEEINLF